MPINPQADKVYVVNQKAIPVALNGINDSNSSTPVHVTPEGHLEVAIHAPRLPFGEISVESLESVFQSDAVYGINTYENLSTTDGTGGTVTATNNLFTVSTGGTTAGYFGSMQSRKRLRYRPGQGVVSRFSMIFTQGIANNTQVCGVGTGESTFAFGYNGTSFGILHSRGGFREIQTLTVSVGAGGGENVTVKLNGVDTIVAVTAGNATATAYTLSKATYVGWKAEQKGATVIFLANDVGNKASTFSLASTGTTTGTFAETRAGVAATDVWVPQTDWNGDKMDGTGNSTNASGILLDPTKGNIASISIQYLGFGSVTFSIEGAFAGNNSDFIAVHTFAFPNSRTTTTITQPSFPFLMATYNTGTASGATSVSCGSYAGFVAGKKKLTGPRMSYFLNTATTSATATYTPIYTVRNQIIFSASGTVRANQAIINLLSVSGATKGNANSVTTFFLIRDATLTGPTSFAVWDATSCACVDTASTGCSFTANRQVIWSTTVTQDGQFIFSFSDELTLQPGETLTLAVRSVSATSTCIGQINTREDQ